MSEIKDTHNEQYLTFTLGDEVFAINIAQVREVLDFTSITKIPRTPVFMKGVINLRGNVVPVIDLRMNLGMGAIEKSIDTCIVIVEVDMDGEIVQIGALADSVQEVIGLDPDVIEPAPKLGTRLNTEYIKGMGKRDENFLIILDIDKVLSADEMSCLRSARNMASEPEVSEQEEVLT